MMSSSGGSHGWMVSQCKGPLDCQTAGSDPALAAVQMLNNHKKVDPAILIPLSTGIARSQSSGNVKVDPTWHLNHQDPPSPTKGTKKCNKNRMLHVPRILLVHL